MCPMYTCMLFEHCLLPFCLIFIFWDMDKYRLGSRDAHRFRVFYEQCIFSSHFHMSAIEDDGLVCKTDAQRGPVIHDVRRVRHHLRQLVQMALSSIFK